MIMDRRFREVAPTAFACPGDNFYEIGDTVDFLKWAFPLFKRGADGFDCSSSLPTIRAMADHVLSQLRQPGPGLADGDHIACAHGHDAYL